MNISPGTEVGPGVALGPGAELGPDAKNLKLKTMIFFCYYELISHMY